MWRGTDLARMKSSKFGGAYSRLTGKILVTKQAGRLVASNIAAASEDDCAPKECWRDPGRYSVYLVSSGDQRVPRQLHERPSSMDGVRRDRGCHRNRCFLRSAQKTTSRPLTCCAASAGIRNIGWTPSPPQRELSNEVHGKRKEEISACYLTGRSLFSLSTKHL
jgi:hypothetical protein